MKAVYDIPVPRFWELEEKIGRVNVLGSNPRAAGPGNGGRPCVTVRRSCAFSCQPGIRRIVLRIASVSKKRAIRHLLPRALSCASRVRRGIPFNRKSDHEFRAKPGAR